MPGAIVVDPRELKAAADAVADRVELCNRAGRALAGVDLGCEMPPGVAGRVRGLVDGARADLLASTARIGPLTADLLTRVDQAERADQIGKAFGGLLGAGGLTAGKLTFAGARIPLTKAEKAAGVDPESKPRIFGASAPPDAALKWASRVGRGLSWAGNAVSVVNSTKKALDNPYLTDQQKATKITAESGSSILKTAAAAAAGGAVAGSIVPGAGTAAGAAGAFVVAVGAGLVASYGLDALDKATGATKAVEKGLTTATSAVGRGAERVASGAAGAAKDVARGAETVAHGAGQVAKDVGRGAEKVGSAVAGGAEKGAKTVAAGAEKVAGAAEDVVDGALGKVGL